ncbi:MAG: SAM-dependent methyltransferase [Spongiibacteraceae bacterium]
MTYSRIITSNQSGLHDKLEAVVRRHLGTQFKRPFPEYSLKVFQQAEQLRAQHSGPVILDSFCGVGESTVNIARQHPDALVIGIDKSSHRLVKHDDNYRDATVPNYHLLQADVDDFWRLALQAGWQLTKHFILYPNPWPKSAHLQRRVQGSPLFPTLLALGGCVELRSNWPIYVEEFAAALTLAGHAASAEPLAVQSPITPFERKYRDSGQALWHCICQLERC